MTIKLPLRLYNPLNNRTHWRVVWSRGQREKLVTTMTLQANALRGGKLPPLPVAVTITRVGKRTMDGDGLQASCKHVRDSIAKAYGRDDGEACFDWRYAQDTGADYAVRVDIETKKENT